jgi:hypothetical protein
LIEIALLQGFLDAFLLPLNIVIGMIRKMSGAKGKRMMAPASAGGISIDLA